ncbi:MAG: hypothetical protein H0U75_03975 [Legionella sp.]|nr:hypothetical protein [Legionella sp.]
MEKQKELFVFLCNYIEIQIKKYNALSSLGAGPDDRLNTRLVVNGVSELLSLATELFNDIKSKTINEGKFETIFEQTRFYLEQERFRAESVWLVAPSIINTTLKTRLNYQLEVLKKIAFYKGLDVSQPAKPKTKIQKQCEYDSYLISLNILKLALQYYDNPAGEVTEIDPALHQTLKRHASGRYVMLNPEITYMYNRCIIFMRNSNKQVSTPTFSPEQIQKQGKHHEKMLKDLMHGYKRMEPSYTSMGHTNAVKIQQPSGYRSPQLTLFSGIYKEIAGTQQPRPRL